MKKIILLLLTITCLLSLAACRKTMDDIIAHEEHVSGIVVETNADDILIENKEGQFLVSLNVINHDSMTHFNKGDQVTVYYDGKIIKSIPMQINTVYAITLDMPSQRDVNK